MARFKDLTKQKFNKLTALESCGKNKRGQYIWKCICECGSEIAVIGTDLTRGHTKSCGNCSGNIFTYKDHFIEGVDSKGKCFYFDIHDFSKIKKHTWYVNNDGYVVSKINKVIVLMHRFVLEVNEDIDVDHRNGVTYDNRKDNLRKCSHQQNSFNQKTNKKYKGITQRNNGKWQSQIGYNGKVIHIGTFSTDIEAAKAYNTKAIELFGEYAKLNEV